MGAGRGLAMSVALGSVLSAAACTTLLGTDLTSDDVDAAAAEGGSPGNGGANEGGASEGAASEGGGASEGGSADDAGAGCDGNFCDDFNTSPVGAAWTSKVVGNGGVVALATPFVSPPTALHATLDPTQARSAAALKKKYASITKLDCEVSVFVIATPSPNEFVDLMWLELDVPGKDDPPYSIYLALEPNGPSLREDVDHEGGSCECPRDASYLHMPALGSNVWRRLGLRIDFGAGTVEVTNDGDTVASGGAGIGIDLTAGTVNFLLGARGYGATTGEVLFDDLVCTVTP